ncbi:MAG: DUF1707 domain-containing protein [Actinomycetota bacterium]|nr:DUF1707 domain-containing protein [Actinomycetota bacterium]
MDATNGTMGVVDGQAPRDRMRAADTDRERVAEQLRSAHAEGRLDLAEYDERVQQAWAARTYNELETLTADLPQARPPADLAASHEVRRPHWQHRHGRGGRAAVTAWAGVSVVNLLIWALVSLATMSWSYPWWIWVAGPWGAMLLAGWIGERARALRPVR